jgi:hypothetical protein
LGFFEKWRICEIFSNPIAYSSVPFKELQRRSSAVYRFDFYHFFSVIWLILFLELTLFKWLALQHPFFDLL